MKTLYYGDNLDILKNYIKDESVDLVYLDPPFNSNATYNVLFAQKDGAQSSAQIQAFEDTWQWDENAVRTYEYEVEKGGAIADALRAFRLILGNSNMMAYLTMIAPRLQELKRVLKDTGSLYLHCDSTASHYLKMLLDMIFGTDNFRNEIIWKRNFTKKGSQYRMTRFANNTDTILFYTKSASASFKTVRVIEEDDEVISKYNLVDEQGRRFKSEPLELPALMARPNLVYEYLGYTPKWGWMMVKEKLEALNAEGKIYFTSGGKPRRKNFLSDYQGREIDNLWIDIFPLGQKQSESMGYPTQKPLALLERIIQASSDPGDIVLDPFCGCGTAVVAAEKLGRKWIGIDITHLAIGLMKRRLEDAFGSDLKYEIIGEPTTFSEAKALANQDKYQFQWWALGLVGARPADEKKGADHGIDGRLFFHDDASAKTKQVILSVKGGKTGVAHVRDLKGVLVREKAEIGVLITMEEATQPMRVEAASAGFYDSPWGPTQYPKMQILTIKELLDGKQIDMPPVSQVNQTFKRASKQKREDHVQGSIFD